MNKIPRQITRIFLEADYYISVEKLNKKEYKYHLYLNEESLSHFTIDKPPETINKTSPYIIDFAKLMENKITVEHDDISIKVDLSSIKSKVLKKLLTLQDMLNNYVSNKENNDNEKRKKAIELMKEDWFNNSEKLINILYNEGISLTSFLFYCADWLNGGEAVNTLKGMFCHLCTYFKIRPIWFIPLGKAGEGKSVIDESAQKLLPPEAFLNGRISEAALHRKSLKLGNNYLDGKIMLMKDMGGILDLEKWSDTIDRYKELTTEGIAEVEKVGKAIDEETGEQAVIIFTLYGHCSVSITSVNSESFDDQILSRGINVTPNANDIQVKKFVKYNKGLINSKREQVIKNDIGLLYDYIRYIKHEYSNIEVINPYWDCLAEWFGESEYYKRNLGLYPSLVEAVTLLNYPFRKTIHTKDKSKLYVISTKEDNQLIANIFNPSTGLSGNAINIFNKLIDWFSKNAGDNEDIKGLCDDEYADYVGPNGPLNLKNTDYLFTASTLKSRATKNKKLRGLPYGEIIQSLLNRGLIREMGKIKNSSKNIYGLESIEKIDTKNIDFDENVVMKYIKDMSQVYSVSQKDLEKVIKSENIENKGFGSNSNFKVPPWTIQSEVEYLKGALEYTAGTEK